jgi:hypothetical protein
MLIHDEVISLFLNVAGTCSTEIELNKLLKLSPMTLPETLKVDWRKRMVARLEEDSPCDLSSPVHSTIRDILAQGSYSITSSEAMLHTMLTMHKLCCVAVSLPHVYISAPALQPRLVPTHCDVLRVPLHQPITPDGSLLSVVCSATLTTSQPNTGP